MLTDPKAWASLSTLTALEVVLSIDNMVVIAALVTKLPSAEQAWPHYVSMTLAMVSQNEDIVLVYRRNALTQKSEG